MSDLALEDPTGRRLSVLPFATLKGAKEYLEWHYPHDQVRLRIDPLGNAAFRVAGATMVVREYRPA